ncbi:signal peptidase I P [Lachnospiraceae bacterium]|jgi:signal peptidase I|nr:signal peptidase I [Eubacterium sp.]GFI28196.1 signal peptidase I P [Lachnospiraceae bacterium]
MRRRGLHFGQEKKKVNLPVMKNAVVWMLEIAIVLAIAFVFVYYIGFRTSVVGQSMAPTLENKQEILVNRFIYSISDPKPNDIVVFLPNGNEKAHYYVKRVIGVPGDTVQIKDGAVYVNGELFEEKVETAAILDAELASEKIVLEEDEYFVLGDNRNNSEDSRYANIGNVKKEYMIGKAWFIVSPYQKFGFID